MQVVMEDWELPVWLTVATLVTAALYLRGWLALRKTRPEQFDSTKLLFFMAGMTSLWISIGSPLDAFADVLLSAHMVEHLILMMVVPPLVLLGQPVVPLLRGLPRFLRMGVAGPLLRFRPLRKLVHGLVYPPVAWLAMNVTLLAWHVPGAYDFALENECWHDVEHLCFLIGAMLFWWCVLQPWPARQNPYRWSMLLYLITADFVNTGLSAFLAFCNRPVYAFYVQHPNPFQIQPVPDQVLGAVVMWVLGSLAYLVPAGFITMGLLLPARKPRELHRA